MGLALPATQCSRSRWQLPEPGAHAVRRRGPTPATPHGGPTTAKPTIVARCASSWRAQCWRLRASKWWSGRRRWVRCV